MASTWPSRVYGSRERARCRDAASTQATQPGADLTAPTARTRQPAARRRTTGRTTSPGGGTRPAGRESAHPAALHVPSPFLRIEESDEEFHERLLAEFIGTRHVRARAPGVLSRGVGVRPLRPPQLPEPGTEAKRRGLAVICDEVMCGLGRHGRAAASVVWRRLYAIDATRF